MAKTIIISSINFFNMKKLLIITLSLFILVSCKKDLPDVGNTNSVNMANEWWVTLDQGATKDVFGIGHFKIATYNTSANDNTMWVDDFKNGWGFKVKVTADYSALTFGVPAGGSNLYYNPASPSSYPVTVKITNGKIFPNAGHSKSGNVTDSIYFNIEFADDPGTIYSMPGHARTRFSEDEY